MEENLNKELENKGYVCGCECYFHQIKKLGLKEENIPNLRSEKRIGVIKRLSVTDKKIEDEDKPLEEVETEITVLKKYWYESFGQCAEFIIILEKSERTFNSIEEVENNLDDIIKLVPTKCKELNEYNKKVTLM